MTIDRRIHHRQQVAALAMQLNGNTQPLRVKKRTISNLFRYEGRQKQTRREVDLRAFDQTLYLDTKKRTLEVQGLATYESIVDAVLPYGLTPVITPELKHITIGGATVGIGIETNSFRHGFVHDSLLEADVLLPSGEVVICSPDNEYADLFYGLANSYGTLGYILRAKIQLHKAKPYVRLSTKGLHSTRKLVAEMKKASQDTKNDYIESLFYSKNELYLTTAKQTNKATSLTSIYGPTVFYKEISKKGELTLTMKDYLFRYDPEWFWALPHTGFYDLFRRFAPLRFRNSSFFARFSRRQTAIAAKVPALGIVSNDLEHLIQDWEVPWKHAQSLLDFALKNLDLDGKPLMTAPVATPAKATSYPMKPGALYLNLGSYNFVKKKPDQEPYYNTKIMDEFCFAHDGIKMLYSTTFLDEKKFNRIYNGKKYAALKKKYDPQMLLPTLYEKAVKAY
jgi:hypothetical protein